MSRVNYRALAEALRDALVADPALAGVTVAIDADQEFAIDQARFVGVYTVARRLTAGQPLAASTRLRYEVDFILWCAVHHPESFADAAKARDDLVGAVEVALLTAALTFLAGAAVLRLPRGGALEGFRHNEGAYLATGDVEVTVEVVATT